MLFTFFFLFLGIEQYLIISFSGLIVANKSLCRTEGKCSVWGSLSTNETAASE
jgi:hypothetical protein